MFRSICAYTTLILTNFQGMARAMSRQFLGTQIDAVYHTSLVFDGIEYFYGQGIATCRAGTTHHGKPMEIIPMGQTALPIEVILEYLDSLRSIYTAEVRLHYAVWRKETNVCMVGLRPLFTQL